MILPWAFNRTLGGQIGEGNSEALTMGWLNLTEPRGLEATLVKQKEPQWRAMEQEKSLHSSQYTASEQLILLCCACC